MERGYYFIEIYDDADSNLLIDSGDMTIDYDQAVHLFEKRAGCYTNVVLKKRKDADVSVILSTLVN